MSVTVSPANSVGTQLQAVPPAQAKVGMAGKAAPLFCDLAANTSTPIPSLSGC